MSVVITRTITLGLIRVISDLLGAGEGSRDHVPPSTSLIGSCSCTTNASTTNSFSFARVAGSLTGSPLLSSSPLPPLLPPPPCPVSLYGHPGESTTTPPPSLHPPSILPSPVAFSFSPSLAIYRPPRQVLPLLCLR